LSGVKCINNCFSALCISAISVILLTGCAGKSFEMPYNTNSYSSSFAVSENSIAETGNFFAEELCVVSGNVTNQCDFKLENATAAGLFDLNSQKVIYAENVHTKLDPASLTKIMTALLAIKYGNPDDIVVASSNACSITESGAQLLGLEPGDTMTLSQALHALLMYSANDVAVAIAEHIGGTEAEFADMMNEEARKLGATNCNFINSNGLTNENHYVTAYDLYLIFNEAIKYELFTEIISRDSYSATYTGKNGGPKEMDFGTTNLFLKGTYHAPDNITILGGKTGTTTAARNCLILLSKDIKGNSYISVILKAEERGILYEQMTKLLGEI